MSGNSTDSLYSQKQTQVSDFVFDKKVVDVFADMIKRSVPGYATTLHMMELLAPHYVKANTNVYDLGCSLGAGLFAICEGLQDTSSRLIGVDNSQDMITQCRQNIKSHSLSAQCSLRCEDIQQTTIEHASMVVLNFTLQFIPPEERLPLLQKIRQGMLNDGVLILSEKLAFENPQTQTLLTELHHDFKRLQGYSDIEISQKRAAIEKVLIPETLHKHQQRLSEAGFARSEVWFQCLNFVSILAFPE